MRVRPLRVQDGRYNRSKSKYTENVEFFQSKTGRRRRRYRQVGGEGQLGVKRVFSMLLRAIVDIVHRAGSVAVCIVVAAVGTEFVSVRECLCSVD